MTVAERLRAALHAPRPRRRDRRRGADPGPGAAPRRAPTLVVSEADILDGIAWSLVVVSAEPAAPHPVTGRALRLAGRRPAPGWPGRSGRHDAGAERRRLRPSSDAARLGLPRLPAAGALARGRRRRQAGGVRRRAVLGPPDRRAGARPTPAVLVVGLAPAAHGANRTGRVFTGDRSGDWLFASPAPGRPGHAGRPACTPATASELIGTRMVAAGALRAADNKPTTDGARHLRAVARARARLWSPHVRVVVALGCFGWDAALRTAPRARVGRAAAQAAVRPRRRGRRSARPGAARSLLLGCYHPSQQNTFTGRLTEPMLDDVLGRAAGRLRLTGRLYRP